MQFSISSRPYQTVDQTGSRTQGSVRRGGLQPELLSHSPKRESAKHRDACSVSGQLGAEDGGESVDKAGVSEWESSRCEFGRVGAGT